MYYLQNIFPYNMSAQFQDPFPFFFSTMGKNLKWQQKAALTCITKRKMKNLTNTLFSSSRKCFFFHLKKMPQFF